jgi:hypothetical protein
MRIAAYAFHRPSVRESIDVQDTLIFSKPDWGLDWCPIPFETLQVEILLTRKGSEVGARHSRTFMPVLHPGRPSLASFLAHLQAL